MAKKSEETAEIKEAKKSQETKYKTTEFVEAAQAQFGLEPFMVKAALEPDKEYTLKEATSIIQKFVRTEVK